MCAIELEPVITTQRLRLRKPRRSDAAQLAIHANDFDVARMTTGMPYPYGVDHAEGFLEKTSEGDPAREAVFVIDHPDHGAIGVLGFHTQEGRDSEIGYWLGRPWWGEGYATEAAKGALIWAHQAWGRRFMRAGHFTDNPASGQVLCNAGFLYTGDVELRSSVARGGQATPTRMMVWLA
ncbi:GNAT family N-acetyltransferase [Phenylobacterium sp.]|jgi:RimJ/RimL family protein N-acetyltransferase|uniref:GNAT family N-acetyltransferase n=1 Tax=Phenylobacterium sp. TaxID=1871053 RepID=UPI0035AFA566